jgi:hypothetical protein
VVVARVTVRPASPIIRPVVETPAVVVAASEIAAVVEPVTVAVEVVVALAVIPVGAPTGVVVVARTPVVFRCGRWLGICGGRDTQAGQA